MSRPKTQFARKKGLYATKSVFGSDSTSLCQKHSLPGKRALTPQKVYSARTRRVSAKNTVCQEKGLGRLKKCIRLGLDESRPKTQFARKKGLHASKSVFGSDSTSLGQKHSLPGNRARTPQKVYSPRTRRVSAKNTVCQEKGLGRLKKCIRLGLDQSRPKTQFARKKGLHASTSHLA